MTNVEELRRRRTTALTEAPTVLTVRGRLRGGATVIVNSSSKIFVHIGGGGISLQIFSVDESFDATLDDLHIQTFTKSRQPSIQYHQREREQTVRRRKDKNDKRKNNRVPWDLGERMTTA